MMSAISQYSLVSALQAGNSSPLNSSNPTISHQNGKGTAQNPQHKKEPSNSSFARLLETAVLGYRT